MYLENLWLKKSDNGNRIREYLDEVRHWKHRCSLSGASQDYDFFLGCYGNPHSKIVFIAEIPSLTTMKRFMKRSIRKKIPEDQWWKSAWNVSRGDIMFRQALTDHRFIPKEAGDEPWKWHCWVTDFVKCPEYTKVWNKVSNKKCGQEILRRSAEYLKQELEIIKPAMIVIMGKRTLDIHNKYMQNKLSIKPVETWVYHYSRKGGSGQKKLFLNRFDKIESWYQRLKRSKQ